MRITSGICSARPRRALGCIRDTMAKDPSVRKGFSNRGERVFREYHEPRLRAAGFAWRVNVDGAATATGVRRRSWERTHLRNRDHSVGPAPQQGRSAPGRGHILNPGCLIRKRGRSEPGVALHYPDQPGVSSEPPGADPHAGWCGSRELITSGQPVGSRFCLSATPFWSILIP
jgi:hypothetical protein